MVPIVRWYPVGPADKGVRCCSSSCLGKGLMEQHHSSIEALSCRVSGSSVGLHCSEPGSACVLWPVPSDARTTLLPWQGCNNSTVISHDNDYSIIKQCSF
jgi:hypothetical protein